MSVVLEAQRDRSKLVLALPDEMTTRQGSYSDLATARAARERGIIIDEQLRQYEKFSLLDTVVRQADLLNIVKTR